MVLKQMNQKLCEFMTKLPSVDEIEMKFKARHQNVKIKDKGEVEKSTVK